MPRLLSRNALKKTIFAVVCFFLRIQSSLRPRRVVVYYKHRDFARKSEAFADLLRSRGFDVELCSGLSFITRALLQTSPDLWIGFWNEVPLQFLPKHYVFLNAEPLNVKMWSDNADWLKVMKNAEEIWGYTKSNAEYVAKIGVMFHFVPLGYAPYYESIFRKHTQGKNLPQDIDVLFCGSISERRRRILDALKQRGMNVHVVNRDKETYGEELDELFTRSKILLGMHYFDEPQAQIADLARVDHLLSNRLFVVHERPSRIAADPAFEENVTTCEYDAIADTCAYFLARPEERASKAAKAHAWFKSKYALDNFIPYDDVRNLLGRK